MEKRDDRLSIPTTRINAERASRALGVDGIFNAKLMSCLMALYQDEILAKEAYNEIISDAYEVLSEHETQAQNLLGSSGLRERGPGGYE